MIIKKKREREEKGEEFERRNEEVGVRVRKREIKDKPVSWSGPITEHLELGQENKNRGLMGR